VRAACIAALIACAAVIAGCGGGGSGALQTTSLAPANAAPGGTYTEATIVVPSTASAQSTQRRAQYVSPASLGLQVTVTDVPPTGGTASFAAIITTYALATGTNKIVVPTPATATGHTEDITYVAYDLAPVANAIPTTAKAVGWGLSTGLTILPGANTNNLALSGVVDTFATPLAETGSFGMMSVSGSTFGYAGAQTSNGFGGAGTGTATFIDAGGNAIATSDGGPWPVVGAVPTSATVAATGVPVTVAETAGSCGAIGTGKHLGLAFAGSAAATSAALTTTNGALALDYDGNGGAGWYAIVTAKAQSKSLVYTLSSLALTSTSSSFNCATQTLGFTASTAPAALMTIVQHVAATPYTLTVPASCSPFVNVYSGNSTASVNLIPQTTPTSLGANTTFTVQENTPGTTQCLIEIQDANAGATSGANDPGATTYLAVLPPGYTQVITVP
jgi:hypothetical protein